MTVSAAVRLEGKRTGPQWSTDGSRIYKDQYRVITSGDVTGDLVEKASGLPRRNASHPRDGGALVTNIKPEQQAATVWFVRVTWKSKHGDPETNDGGGVDDPLSRPAKFRWEKVDYEETRSKDLDGKPFHNTLGQPLPNPPKFPVTQLRLIVTRNQATYDPAEAFSYGNRVNSDGFLGQKPQTAKMDLPTAIEQVENGISFWSVTYSIEFKEDGWNPVKLPNEGLEYTPPGESTGVRKAMDDDFGATTGEWGLLTEFSKKMPAGQDPFMLEFRVYKSKAFGPLGLL